MQLEVFESRIMFKASQDTYRVEIKEPGGDWKQEPTGKLFYNKDDAEKDAVRAVRDWSVKNDHKKDEWVEVDRFQLAGSNLFSKAE